MTWRFPNQRASNRRLSRKASWTECYPSPNSIWVSEACACHHSWLASKPSSPAISPIRRTAHHFHNTDGSSLQWRFLSLSTCPTTYSIPTKPPHNPPSNEHAASTSSATEAMVSAQPPSGRHPVATAGISSLHPPPVELSPRALVDKTAGQKFSGLGICDDKRRRKERAERSYNCLSLV
jgi:hypothetical protein